MVTDSIQGFDSFANATLLASSGAGIGAEGLLKSAAIVHQRGWHTIDYRRIYIEAPVADDRRAKKKTAPAGRFRRDRFGIGWFCVYLICRLRSDAKGLGIAVRSFRAALSRWRWATVGLADLLGTRVAADGGVGRVCVQ
jgi:hypothetical protein